MSKSFFASTIVALVFSVVCHPSSADQVVDIFGRDIRANARGALALLGISAVPNETASALFLDTGASNDGDFDFRSGQLGGGFRVGRNFPLYLEGYIGYTRYNPEYFFSDSVSSSIIPSKWTGVSATGGIGWEFQLSEYWKFRPVANFTIGRIQSDSSIAAQVVSDLLETELDFLSDGGITAWGYGGSLMAVYNRKWASRHEWDIRARYTHLRLQPTSSSDVVATANARSAVLWSRYRIPTGFKVFGQPTRWVNDVSFSYLPGDQGVVLDTDWLAQIGFGFEIDVSETKVPVISQARVMVKATKGENLDGFSIGIGVSF